MGKTEKSASISNLVKEIAEIGTSIEKEQAILENLKNGDEKEKEYRRTNLQLLLKTRHQLSETIHQLSETMRLNCIEQSNTSANFEDPKFVEGLTEFWKVLAGNESVNGFLTFQSFPPFFKGIPKQFLIRKSYQDIFTIITVKVNYGERNGKLAGRRGFAITGNPGIGKSVFLFYVLWRLRKNGVKSIVLHRAKDHPWIYVFNDRHCFRTMGLEYAYFLDDPDTWYLTDDLPVSPSDCNALTIVVASPDRNHYKEFIKYEKSMIVPMYLPVWNYKELLQIQHLFGLSEEETEKKFHLIGGVPRFVFATEDELEKLFELGTIGGKEDFGQFTNLRHIIQKSIYRMKINNLMLISGEGKLEDTAISRLLIHFKVEENYKRPTFQFASEFVQEEALRHFVRTQKEDLRNFLLSVDNMAFYASLRGNLFQGVAFEALSKGGTFRIRLLENEDESSTHHTVKRNSSSISELARESTLVLPQRRMETFKELGCCTDSNVLYTAKRMNAPCIDALIPKVGLFQMTITDDQGIEMEYLLNIVEITGLQTLYFVVPHSLFHEFKNQILPTTKKSDVIGNTLSSLQLYVLSINMESQLRTI